MAARGTACPGVTPAWQTGQTSPATRARNSRPIRDRPRVVGYQDPRRSALAVISTGIAGLPESSSSLSPAPPRAGGGARLASEV